MLVPYRIVFMLWLKIKIVTLKALTCIKIDLNAIQMTTVTYQNHWSINIRNSGSFWRVNCEIVFRCLEKEGYCETKTRKRIYLTLLLVDLITVLIVSALTNIPYSIEKYFSILFTILLTLYCLVPSDKKDNNNHWNLGIHLNSVSYNF